MVIQSASLSITLHLFGGLYILKENPVELEIYLYEMLKKQEEEEKNNI